MKRLIVALMIAALTMFSVRIAYALSEYDNLSVEATVVGSCSLVANPIIFGEVTGEQSEVASGLIEVTCPVSIPYLVSVNAGHYLGLGPVPNLRAMSDQGINFASYELYGSGSEIGDICSPDRPYPYEAPCLSGVGSGAPDSFLLDAVLQPFIGIPIGASLVDNVAVHVYY